MLPLIAGCLGYPDTVQPVTDFELQKYLEKWYEIARLDHSFERGLTKVTAEYSIQDGKDIRVKNRGFSENRGKWDEAAGKAFFVEEQSVGYLKVFFFGPFYGSYVIFEHDADYYQYAFVCSNDYDYLWFLSRTPIVSQELKKSLCKKSNSWVSIQKSSCGLTNS